jgi:DNA-directed RNA polymerase subunit L
MEPVFQNYKDASKVRRNTCAFTLAPTHVAYANTLRRMCMSHVASVGFRADMTEQGTTTDVVVKTNSTPMTNEMLAHRVGLLAIHIQQPETWDSKRYKFVLHKVNTTDQLMDVCAEDFRIIDTTREDAVPQPASQFFPPHPVTRSTALIAVLKPQMPGGEPEEIHIEATATVGVGRENARFIPTCQCAYAYTPDTNPDNLKRAFESWLGRVKMIGNPEALEQDLPKKQALLREFNSLERQRCYVKSESGEPYSFDFTVESRGVLPPEYIVMKAIEAGMQMCEKYTGEVLPSDVTVVPYDGNFRAIDFYFQKHDHTFGHMIQAWLDANRVGNGQITFAGYDIPHPLRDEMVLRIGVEGSENAEVMARRVVREAVQACYAMFQLWSQQWTRVALGGAAPAFGRDEAVAVAAAAQPVQATQQRPRITVKRPTGVAPKGVVAAAEPAAAGGAATPEPAAAGGGGGAAEQPTARRVRVVRRPGQA